MENQELKPPVRLIYPSRLVPPGVAAWVPLPGVILAKRGYLNAGTIAHELVHIDQWERLGWRFPFVYLWQWVSVGFKYEKIPFELEARNNAHLHTLWAIELLEARQ